MLCKPFAVGGGEDNLVVVAFGGQLTDNAVDRLYLQDHTCAKAKGIIVHLAMFIQSVITQVVYIDFR